MEREKGITLITLVITIIILMIITAVITYSGAESIASAKKVAFISEMEMIQVKVNSIYEERKSDTSKVEYYDSIGKDVSSVDSSKITTALGETSQSGFRYFKISELEEIGLYSISQEVLINYDTREVVSLTGIEIDGIMYYKLSDIPDYIGYNVEYVAENTDAPEFTVEQVNLDDGTYKFIIKDIVYNSNVDGGTVSYKLHSDTNWILNGENTSFIVTSPGIYDIKLTDKAGNETTTTQYIYVQDGIIAYYDGENNTGTGHSNTTTTWKDLSGNDNDATLTDCTILDDGIECSDDGAYFQTADINLEENADITIEITFKENKFVTYSSSSDNAVILTSNNEWNSFKLHTWYEDSTTKMVDGRIYIGGNATSGGDNCRFIPSEMDGYKTQEGKTDKITYTYNGTTNEARLYINSKLIATKTYTAEPEAIQYFKTGTSNQKTYNSLCIYNRALTDDEIKINYEIDNYRFSIE